MADRELSLFVASMMGTEETNFCFRRLVCAGWVGRNKVALQAHIDELAELGVPVPTRTPIYMNLALHLLTQAEIVEVISEETSGEVEYVAFTAPGGTYIGVGSDHTDRGFERHGIPASKQMYAKVVAPEVWPYQEIKDHWDQIILRSWTTRGGERLLYQEDYLAAILDLETLLADLPKDDGLPADGLVLFSGTVASKHGLIYGDSFQFEMDDPVLGRKISHKYEVRVLPQYI
jgi:hypothetical protein